MSKVPALPYTTQREATAQRFAAGFPQQRPGYDPRSGHVGFMVDKVAQRLVFSEYFYFP
jgi:hypothetical protein